jgi:hypothetical protein
LQNFERKIFNLNATEVEKSKEISSLQYNLFSITAEIGDDRKKNRRGLFNIYDFCIPVAAQTV